MSWEETKARLPEGIYEACNNTENTQTISGPMEKVADFVTTLQNEDIFAKQVNSAGIPFHSPYMEPALKPLEERLKLVCLKVNMREIVRYSVLNIQIFYVAFILLLAGFNRTTSQAFCQMDQHVGTRGILGQR